MKSFNQFINESVRDLMTGKSEEDILKELGNITPEELFKKGDWSDQGWLIIEAIKRGFDVNAKNKLGLNTIVKQNFVDVVKYLLEQGVDFSPTKEFDPFRIAAINGHNAIIKLLIKYKIKLDSINIQWARSMGRHVAYQLLKDYYNKTNESVRDLMTPKPEDDVKKAIANLSSWDKMHKIIRYDMVDIFTFDELLDIADKVIKKNPDNQERPAFELLSILWLRGSKERRKILELKYPRSYFDVFKWKISGISESVRDKMI